MTRQEVSKNHKETIKKAITILSACGKDTKDLEKKFFQVYHEKTT